MKIKSAKIQTRSFFSGSDQHVLKHLDCHWKQQNNIASFLKGSNQNVWKRICVAMKKESARIRTRSFLTGLTNACWNSLVSAVKAGNANK